VDKKESKANLLIVALPQAGGELPYGWLRRIHIYIGYRLEKSASFRILSCLSANPRTRLKTGFSLRYC
jgi:hypothetical protein